MRVGFAAADIPLESRHVAWMVAMAPGHYPGGADHLLGRHAEERDL